MPDGAVAWLDAHSLLHAASPASIPAGQLKEGVRPALVSVGIQPATVSSPHAALKFSCAASESYH